LIVTSAPAKVILVGEHFVVENEPAIALAVELRARAIVEPIQKYEKIYISRNYNCLLRFSNDKIIERGNVEVLSPILKIVEILESIAGVRKGFRLVIESDIPPASGMGSSAAVAVATVTAMGKLYGIDLTHEDITRIAYEAEKLVHGTPSGIDNTVSTYGGVIVFRKNEGFIKLDVDLSSIRVIIADSGIPRSTGAMVKAVRELRKRYPSVFDPLYHTAGRLAIETAKALEDGDFKRVGELMNVNHGLLSAIGVSNIKLEELVYTARSKGALGAKITGAGGGGSIIALVYVDEEEEVAEALNKISKKVYVLEIAKEGVRIERTNE